MQGGVNPPNSPSTMAGQANIVGLPAGDGPDLKAVSRFDANIQANGTFKPGEPIQIVINVRAKLPTEPGCPPHQICLTAAQMEALNISWPFPTQN